MGSRIERLEKEVAALKALIRKRKPRRKRTIVTSVSIAPELKIQAERELGNGNFSRAVTYALERVLQEEDQ